MLQKAKRVVRAVSHTRPAFATGRSARVTLPAEDEVEDRLTGLLPLKPFINGDLAHTVPNIVNLSIPGMDAEAVMEAWSDLVAISDGAACTSQSYTCSHVLSAMNLSEERKAGALRLSWCHSTPDPDYGAMVEAVRSIAVAQ